MLVKMRTQIYQILYSDSRPFAHHVVKGLFLLAVGAVAAVAMIETLPRFDQATEAVNNDIIHALYREDQSGAISESLGPSQVPGFSLAVKTLTGSEKPFSSCPPRSEIW